MDQKRTHTVRVGRTFFLVMVMTNILQTPLLMVLPISPDIFDALAFLRREGYISTLSTTT